MKVFLISHANVLTLPKVMRVGHEAKMLVEVALHNKTLGTGVRLWLRDDPGLV